MTTTRSTKAKTAARTKKATRAARERPAGRGPEITNLTHGQVAEAFGIRLGRLKQWISKGCPVNRDGTFNALAVLQWIVCEAAEARGRGEDPHWSLRDLLEGRLTLEGLSEGLVGLHNQMLCGLAARGHVFRRVVKPGSCGPDSVLHCTNCGLEVNARDL